MRAAKHATQALCILLATAAAADSDQQFAEGIEVHLVTVRVHVSTPGGSSIRGLDATDFVVSEDGESVQIHSVEGPVLSSAETLDPRPEDGGDVRSEPKRIAIVFNSTSMLWPTVTRAIDRMRKFVQSGETVGTEWSVVVLGPHPMVVTPFTSDLAKVSAGLDSLRALLAGKSTDVWTSLSFATRQAQDESPAGHYDDRTETANANGDRDPISDEPGVHLGENVEMRLRDRKSRARGRAFANMIEGMAVDGSNTTIWLLYGSPYPTRSGSRPMSADVLLSVAKANRAWDAAASAASSAGVPVYSINVRGLERPKLATSYRPHTAPVGGGPVDLEPQEVAKTISAQTGGRAIELNHVIPAAELAFKEYGEAYEITYQVDRAPDGEEHKVEIKVPSHAFATLRYPRRYFDWSARERLVRALNTSAGIPKSGGPLPVELVVNRTETEDGRWTLSVGGRTPTEALGLVEDPDSGERSGRAEWFVALYGQDGLLDELDSQTLTVGATDDDSIAGFELTVDPGEYTVAVAVLDAIDRRSGMAFTRVVGSSG